LAEQFAELDGNSVFFAEQLLEAYWFVLRLLPEARPHGFRLNRHVIARHNLSRHRMVPRVLLDDAVAFCPRDFAENVPANVLFAESAVNLNCFRPQQTSPA
jgi:hypothetical protein